MNPHSVLERISSSVARRVEERKKLLPESRLRAFCEKARKPHPFREAFLQPGMPVIAEVKFASPSAGKIMEREVFGPVAVAREYLRNGAAAISVLTEQDHFHGHPEYLRRIREALPEARLLMKDFVMEEYQLLEGRHQGADAALLIVALLGPKKIQKLLRSCRTLGLTALVEVHDEEELRIAVEAGADLIGVNNRNLKTLEVSVDTSFQLARLAPEGACLISESGLSRRDQLLELQTAGYSGFLIGSSLMKTGAPGAALRDLIGGGK